jgi:hypothetical protein
VAVDEHRYAAELTIGTCGIVDATSNRAPGLTQNIIEASDRIMHHSHDH